MTTPKRSADATIHGHYYDQYVDILWTFDAPEGTFHHVMDVDTGSTFDVHADLVEINP